MNNPHSPHQEFLQRVHNRPKRGLREWLDVPAHIHHYAHRMTDPPTQRPLVRREFFDLLQCLGVAEADSTVGERFGYGVRTASTGDVLIAVWEAHTEYYSHQIWHIPADKVSRPAFGPLTYPGYEFSICPLGVRINALDLVIVAAPHPDREMVRAEFPGQQVWGSQVFGQDIVVGTSFALDEHGRERYLIVSPGRDAVVPQLSQLVDRIVRIENYYHLILLPFPEFTRAVDQIHGLERQHLAQRERITSELRAATPESLLHWVAVLTDDFMKVGRLAESMRFKLAAADPYHAIVHENLDALQERSLPPFRPLADYVFGRISGVADGYRQFLQRIDALRTDFEGTIAIIRTRANLLLQEQNVGLLASLDKTMRSQVLLQHTVEALSIIVIAYYLSGLASYVFRALQHHGWIASADDFSALFMPVSLLVSGILIFIGRRLFGKQLVSPRP